LRERSEPTYANVSRVQPTTQEMTAIVNAFKDKGNINGPGIQYIQQNGIYIEKQKNFTHKAEERSLYGKQVMTVPSCTSTFWTALAWTWPLLIAKTP